LKTMARRNPKNEKVVVVVGGGAAAQEAVESLRNRPEPFTGYKALEVKQKATVTVYIQIQEIVRFS